jgi:sterol desaturase/sphingolipid hydroxylase (fatty acid hydroxylase superfamily)
MKTPKRSLWVRVPLVLGALGAILWWESRRPLRRSVESKPRRISRNLAIAAVSAAALQVAGRPVVGPLTALVERRQWGLLKRAPLPRWLEVPLALVLLDYTLYIWHVLMHRVPWLWRFHVVHHVDLDLDTSTALRFHFGELTVSVVWQAGQVVLLGISPLAMSVWQTALFLSILFHHSNVRLPLWVERWLVRFIITPRMHGIHHSIVREETDANWSSGLTLWDWLHGTLRLNVPQGEITIGVPAYRAPAEVTLPNMLALPFREQRPTWQFPDGGQPTRRPAPMPPESLRA